MEEERREENEYHFTCDLSNVKVTLCVVIHTCRGLSIRMKRSRTSSLQNKYFIYTVIAIAFNVYNNMQVFNNVLPL